MSVITSAVEIWDYVPEWPSPPAVLSDRWIVVADNRVDEFLIFDTETETSAAFSGIGKLYTRTAEITYTRPIIEYGGYAWAVGSYGSPVGVLSLCRIDHTGNVTHVNVGGGGIPLHTFGGAIAADGGNIWVSIAAADFAESLKVSFFGFVDPTTMTATKVSTALNPVWFTAGNGVVARASARWDSTDGTPLANGNNIAQTAGNPTLDGVNQWTISSNGKNVDTINQTDNTKITTSPGIASPSIPQYGPHNLMYTTEQASPNTGLAVIDRTIRNVGAWNFPIARTNRLSVAYANGKMWAFSGEDPNA